MLLSFLLAFYITLLSSPQAEGSDGFQQALQYLKPPPLTTNPPVTFDCKIPRVENGFVNIYTEFAPRPDPKLQPASVNPGTTVALYCIDGYRLNTAPQITCQDNGKWSTEQVDYKCNPLGCIVPKIANGQLQWKKEGGIAGRWEMAGTIAEPGFTIRLTCDAGFFASNATLTSFCLASTLNWTEYLAKCIKLADLTSTPVPALTVLPNCLLNQPAIENGKLVGHGARREIVCDDGFTLTGPAFVECDPKTNKWSTAGLCKRKLFSELPLPVLTTSPSSPLLLVCLVTPKIENGHLVGQGLRREVVCNDGYSLVGLSFIECQGGKWSEPGNCLRRVTLTTPPRLSIASCQVPTDVRHGEVLYYEERSGIWRKQTSASVAIGTELKLLCDVRGGFVLENGAGEVTCAVGGKLIPELGHCIRQQQADFDEPCLTSKPSPVNNGQLFQESKRRYVVKCDRGYNLFNGPSFTECLVGKWSPTGQCLKNCAERDLPPVVRGRVADGPNTHGTQRGFICEAGFGVAPKSPQTVDCNDGTWSEGGFCIRQGLLN